MPANDNDDPVVVVAARTKALEEETTIAYHQFPIMGQGFEDFPML